MRHRHSSEETAEKCWVNTTRRKGDRKLRYAPRNRYAQVHHDPPVAVKLGSVEVLYFFSGKAR